MFKNIDETRLVIYGATAIGTAYLYNALGLLDILTEGKKTKKDTSAVLKELKPQLLSACFYFDGLPSIIDEKSQSTASLRARLYYYGSPIDYPNPPVIRDAPPPTPNTTGSIWEAVNNAGNDIVNNMNNPAIDQRLLIYNIIKDAIDMGNSTLPQKIPPADEVKFLTDTYFEYRPKMIASWNSGIKTRIPHQPYLSCLPIVFEVIRKVGYGAMFNENAALYRCISYQETMRRELPQEEKKAVIVDGINISTGKTVVEEPPPPDAVVIPTKGPHAGKVIPISETAIM